MENAAEALKMAAFVLIFVVTLTITISSFSDARQVAEVILDYQDKTFDYTYVDFNAGTTERIVDVETIIPSIYRAFLENYKIYFFDKSGNKMELFKKYINGTDQSINYIDLQGDEIVPFGSDKQKEEFILAILYGDNYDNFPAIKEFYKENYRISLKDDGLYDIIKSNKFNEALGVYYEEDIDTGGTGGGSTTATTEPNKNKKRIITYKML